MQDADARPIAQQAEDLGKARRVGVIKQNASHPLHLFEMDTGFFAGIKLAGII